MTRLPHKPSFSLSKSYILFSFCLFICLIQPLRAQYSTNDKAFESRVSQSIIEKEKDYKTLEDLFDKDKKDSTKMQYLAHHANANNAFDIKSFALNALGSIYRNKTMYEKAITTYLEAEEAAITAKNDVLEVISLNMLGVVYRRMDLIKPALDYHKKAYDLASEKFRMNPDPEFEHSMAVSRNSMGNIYLTLEQYDLALKQFERSLEIEKKADNILGLAINYQNIGYALEMKGLLNKALENYFISLDYNEQMDSDIGRVICDNAIAHVYIKQEQYEEALNLLKEAHETALKAGDQYYITETYLTTGITQIKLKQYTEAEKNLKTGLQLSRAYQFKTFTADALLHLAELQSLTGDYKTAYENFKESKLTEDSVSNDRNLNYVNDLIIQYEHESKNNQIKELSDENEIVKNKLERNKKLFWYTAILISLFTTMIIIIIRHRQVKQEKQIITLEQDMLRSQMNPHFIFNSLNSIKLYIINNDKEKAVYYLNKFSKLIRKILIASTEKEMSLEEELDTMRLYINIENIRFQNEINFKIKVDDGINISNIKVPSLILQPFLENALWHGLSSKKHDKKIDLHVFKPSKDYITISIEDNGIGRKESAKINSLKVLKRKSVGIAITKARLANFSKRYGNNYTFDIEDLYNDKQRPKGTKVTLHIPLPKLAKA
ncbi:tetratricopeptide repeat protein [Formosa sp. S-31]|uniref:tetratricopeptide repeat protein n=1 Tax=Formosa sp. S-31 TaxID=2790949 RepID=UPI003EB8A1CD